MFSLLKNQCYFWPKAKLKIILVWKVKYEVAAVPRQAPLVDFLCAT
jgi:hypothetical protein